MKENYDVIVVGAGPAGIMTCYELYLKNPELEVLLIDKGHDVMNRHCPIKDKKIVNVNNTFFIHSTSYTLYHLFRSFSTYIVFFLLLYIYVWHYKPNYY